MQQKVILRFGTVRNRFLLTSFLALVCLTSFSQTSIEKKKYEDAAFKYFTSKYGAEGQILVENIRFVKRDTLTECKSFQIKAFDLKKKSERLFEDAQELNRKYELMMEKAALYKEIYGSESVLAKSELQRAEEEKKAYEAVYAEVLKLRERYIAYDVDFIANNCNRTNRIGWMCTVGADFVEKESGKLIHSGEMLLVFNDSFRIVETE